MAFRVNYFEWFVQLEAPAHQQSVLLNSNSECRFTCLWKSARSAHKMIQMFAKNCFFLIFLFLFPISIAMKTFQQQATATMATLNYMHKTGPIFKRKSTKKIIDGKPFAKGVVLRTLIKKPKKPNSANRKCVLVRLSTGDEMVAYVPGIGHNLQEHNVVLCRVARLRDTPGVKLKCVRGAYDLPHVIKRPQ